MAQESNLLPETPMLDYSHPSIQTLIQSRRRKLVCAHSSFSIIFRVAQQS